MLNFFLCGYNVFCHLDNLNYQINRPKYPPDVEIICQYFEQQRTDLPDYCKWKDLPKKPRHRSEY